MKKTIILDTSENIGAFINIASKGIYDNVDINVRHGKFMVDGKSILGVMSLGCENELEVEIVTDDIRLADTFMDDIKKFLCYKGE